MTRRIPPLRPVLDPGIRYGAVASGGYPAPVLRYDTRNAGPPGSMLRNEGSAGAVWDLPILAAGSVNWAIKRRNWYTQPNTGSFLPTSWDDLGGDPCGSPFVYVVAVPTLVGDPSGDYFTETEWYWNAANVNGYSIGFTGLYEYFDYPLPGSYGGVFGRVFSDAPPVDDEGTFIEWYPDAESPQVGVHSVAVVFYADNATSTARCWVVNSVGENLVGTTDEAADSSFNYSYDWGCAPNSRGSEVQRMFWSVGYDYTAGTPDPGGGWNGVRGVELYRADEPSAGQRRAFYDGFFS